MGEWKTVNLNRVPAPSKWIVDGAGEPVLSTPTAVMAQMIVEAHNAALLAAVEAERNACAEIAKSLKPDCDKPWINPEYVTAELIQARIMARSKPA